MSSPITPPPPSYRSGRTSVASSSGAVSFALPRYASHDPVVEPNRKPSIYSRGFAPVRWDRKASTPFERAEQVERLPPMSSSEGRRPSVVPRRVSVRDANNSSRHTPAQLRARNIFIASLAAVILLVVFVLAYKRIEEACKGQVDTDFCRWGGWTNTTRGH